MDGEPDNDDNESVTTPLLGIRGLDGGGWSPFVRQMIAAYTRYDRDLLNAVMQEAVDDPEVHLATEIFNLTGLLWAHIEASIVGPEMMINSEELPGIVSQYLIAIAANEETLG